MGLVPPMHEPLEEIELFPPSPARVAARTVVMSAVVARAFIDGSAGDPQAESMYNRIRDWLNALQIDEELEQHEIDMLTTPLGSLQPQDRIDYSWQSEGLAVLAWSLRLMNLPPHDEPVDPHQVAKAVGFLTDAARQLIGHQHLRPQEELDSLAERQFALHWRLVTFAKDQKRIDFEAFAKGDQPDNEFGPLDISGVPLIGGDLAIKGGPLFGSQERDWKTALSIAEERHRAANWLIGYRKLYSETEAQP